MTNEYSAGTVFKTRESIDLLAIHLLSPVMHVALKFSVLDQSGPAGYHGNRCRMCRGKSESSGPITNPNKQEHASGT